MSAHERSGVTFLELMVVITIIAILAAIRLPALARARASEAPGLRAGRDGATGCVASGTETGRYVGFLNSPKVPAPFGRQDSPRFSSGLGDFVGC